ncbi:uncharacterized protein LOC128892127 isoform X1 [Hylaeus anthracinus]|uniref:uncharacterized protein LOC128892127 isoform X1 n=1 Tax=Hylaeus anthracinus TaxID=313031 RepID=UPI0023B92F8A|nr:uncharacterized protein LOC128892127 isoform X1 [Hylaeus anthracinus]
MASGDTAVAESTSTKLYTRNEVKTHTDSSDVWIIINNSVYDLTSFLNKHPGGEEVLLEHAGRDGTEAFEDIGHSSDAREMMVSYKIGELVEAERTNGTASGLSKDDNSRTKNMASGDTAVAESTSTKLYTRNEVKTHTDSSDVWIIINNSVYDLTSFMNKHPGGEEVLLEHAGRDGTEAFEDIGHSSDAREMMVPYKIGELVEAERTNGTASGMSEDDNSSGSWRSWLIPIALGVLATLVYRYFIKAH